MAVNNEDSTQIKVSRTRNISEVNDASGSKEVLLEKTSVVTDCLANMETQLMDEFTEKIVADNDGEEIEDTRMLDHGDEVLHNEIVPSVFANEYNAPTLTNCEAIQPEDNNGNGSNWKMALYPSSQQQANACITIESLEPKLASTRNYENSAFSMAWQDFSRIDLVNSTQPMVENPTGVGSEDPNEKGINLHVVFRKVGLKSSIVGPRRKLDPIVWDLKFQPIQKMVSQLVHEINFQSGQDRNVKLIQEVLSSHNIVPNLKFSPLILAHSFKASCSIFIAGSWAPMQSIFVDCQGCWPFPLLAFLKLLVALQLLALFDLWINHVSSGFLLIFL
ncbi:hypothetical protein V6N13_082440 [Hibiscus sabdariffa]